MLRGRDLVVPEASETCCSLGLGMTEEHAKPFHAVPEPPKETPKSDSPPPPAKTLKGAVLRVIGDGKHLPGVLMATAALVTAITSMVKAVDTSVERASYNALSKEIREIRTNQAALWDAMQAISSAKPTVTLIPPPTLSAAVSAAATAHGGGRVRSVPTAHPVPPVTPPLMASAAPSAAPSAMVAVVVEPPTAKLPPRMVYIDTPSFDQVQAEAAAEK